MFYSEACSMLTVVQDGQAPKRRGPKPDSKPALTRRQELNRQAQRYRMCSQRDNNFSTDRSRTHRERKEMYIKALEQEVLRLKETFTSTIRERDLVAEENQRLKQLLAQHGISYDFASPKVKFQREESSYGGSSSGSISGSYQPASNSTGFSPPPLPGQMSMQHGIPPQANTGRSMAQLPSARIDYDQVGIDFVLTYDSQGRPIPPAPYPSPPPQL